jgi:phage baseplate assembly protein W
MARSFKSVGTLSTNKKFEIKSQKNPIGFKTPLRLGTIKEGIFAMNYDMMDQIQDNLKNLLLTNHGERLGFYDFGANLLPLVFESSSDVDVEEDAMTRIKTAVQKYLPFVDLQEFESVFQAAGGDGLSRLKVRLTYDVPVLEIKERSLSVEITGGG